MFNPKIAFLNQKCNLNNLSSIGHHHPSHDPRYDAVINDFIFVGLIFSEEMQPIYVQRKCLLLSIDLTLSCSCLRLKKLSRSGNQLCPV